jgi:hypothetical protein
MKAAERGDMISQYNLGIIYRDGRGVEQNYKRAFEWFMKASEPELIDGQYNIALAYEMGNNIKQDYAKALELYILISKKITNKILKIT